jgi:hypothetical protein
MPKVVLTLSIDARQAAFIDARFDLVLPNSERVGCSEVGSHLLRMTPPLSASVYLSSVRIALQTIYTGFGTIKRAFRNVDEGQGASREESWRSADDPRVEAPWADDRGAAVHVRQRIGRERHPESGRASRPRWGQLPSSASSTRDPNSVPSTRQCLDMGFN